MGMYDESWCASCGTSLPYSEEDVVCGECTSEAYEIRSNKLVEYMKLHLISLEQDSAEINSKMDSTEDLESDEYKVLDVMDISINGQIIATRHLLSVASDILGIQTEEK